MTIVMLVSDPESKLLGRRACAQSCEVIPPSALAVIGVQRFDLITMRETSPDHRRKRAGIRLFLEADDVCSTCANSHADESIHTPCTLGIYCNVSVVATAVAQWLLCSTCSCHPTRTTFVARSPNAELSEENISLLLSTRALPGPHSNTIATVPPRQ